MKNRIPTIGQEGRVLITPENGTAPFYAKMSMADNPIEEGTPFAVETALKDTTAMLYGKDDSAVPDDILAWLGTYNTHWWRVSDGSGNKNYVNSIDNSAYPDFGVVGGLTYEYIGTPLKNVLSAPKIINNYYIGTGNAGVNNPNSLTFDFVPKILVVMNTNWSLMYPNEGEFPEWFIWITGVARVKVHTVGTGTGDEFLRFTQEGKGISWYHDPGSKNPSQNTQLNYNGTYYRYIAIG